MTEVKGDFSEDVCPPSPTDEGICIETIHHDHTTEVTCQQVVTTDGTDLVQLNGNSHAGLASLLHRNISADVTADINLGSLGDMSDNSLTVTDTSMEQHMKDDGGLTNSAGSLLSENLVVFETSKGLVLSVSHLDGLNFSGNFVTSCADIQCPTAVTPSLPGTLYPSIQLVDGSDQTEGGVYESVPDGTLLIPAGVFSDTTEPQIPSSPEVKVKKASGGWPKGKKRKQPPLVMTPRKPNTGYVIFAMKRRQELKLSNPQLSFCEVTKWIGQEWSVLPSDEKEKYIALAEEDKRRYIEEMKTFQSSEQYQNYVKHKKDTGQLNGLMDPSKPLIDVEDGVMDELYCKLCNQYFISAHNKKEHMFGRQHLRNITNTITKDIKEQADLQQQLLLGETEAFSNSAGDSLSPPALQDVCSLDVNQFIEQFLEKNTLRDQEIVSLKKLQHAYEEENLTMSKQLKELGDYESKLDQDLASMKAYGASLSAQVDALKMVPTLFGVVNF